MTHRKIIKLASFAILVCVAASWSMAEDPSTEKQIMKQGDLKAFVSGEAWCQEVVHTVVHAPTAETFKGDRIQVQRMIGHLRIALSEDCPKAGAIMIDGFGDDEHVYTGLASKTSGWILEETIPPRIASHVSDCDLLAGHPDDPEINNVNGIADDDMDGEMALSACLDEVQEQPDDPVLQFQVGRAYWKLGQYSKAVEHFISAAEDDHGGALAYLGDTVLYGVSGVEQDPNLAKQLYARSAEEGFSPAAIIADEIEVGVPNDELQKTQMIPETPKPLDEQNAEEYHYPNLIEALSSGRTEVPGVWVGRMMIYSLSSVTGVFSQCQDLGPKGFDGNDVFLKAMNARLTYAEKLNLTRSYEKGVFVELQEAAGEDGVRLAVTKGCMSKETQTLVKTILDWYVAS